MKDGTLIWIPLKDIKASTPVELAEYAVAKNIEDEPYFKWWLKYVICKLDQIILNIRSKYWRTTHKFGIQVPKTVYKVYRNDQQTVNTFWKK